MSAAIDHLSLYRLPWSLADNAISWLEPTSACNLNCTGCYRETAGGKHKTAEEVRADLELFKALRKSDAMSLSGGDPLVYPDPAGLVRMVRDMGWKPILNTNGAALTPSLLAALKKAGVYGFTFHIDTTQKGQRPGIEAETETDLNDLRLHYAKMVSEAGGIACSFNATITSNNIHEVPEIIRFSQNHADIIHTQVFIQYRSPVLTGDFDFYALGKPVTFDKTYKATELDEGRMTFSEDIVDKIREADPLYEPNSFLNGTANPRSFKWLLANRIVLNGRVMGYVTPRFMEVTQTLKHLFTGTYYSYASPAVLKRGKLFSFLTGLFDRQMMKIWLRIAGRTLRNPLNLFRRAWIQSIMIIQPIHIEPDGDQDMCDACPDITPYKGKLVWSCRLEELRQHGAFVLSVPVKKDPDARP
jgi:hypothetical protein